MPQKDRYKDRVLNIEFKPVAALETPRAMSLALLTHGKAKMKINGQSATVKAPALLFLNEADRVTASGDFAAQSFSFDEAFLKTAPFSREPDQEFHLALKTGQRLFARDAKQKYWELPNKIYEQIREWFFIMGMEVAAQSDELWCCRIKKYLIQILSMAEDLSALTAEDPVSLALSYIYSAYYEKISLEDLTRQACINRVTLNQLFKERFGCTAMEYLTRYRMKIAAQMLTHTGMKVAEIAEAVGFDYDTYFIRIFTAKKGLSPTSYRRQTRQAAERV